MLRFWKRKPKEERTPPEEARVEQTAEPEPPPPEPGQALVEPEPAPAAIPEEPEPAPPASLPETPASGIPVPEIPTPEIPTKKGWLARLRDGLTKSTSRLTDGISGIFTKRKLDDEALEELEELLITADLGPSMAARVTAELAKSRFGKDVTPDEVKRFLADRIAATLAPVARPLALDPAARPHVILVVGVNGAGKTTTIGKMAKQYRLDGRKVMIAAGDTFRAAAVQQLQVWGERAGCPVVAKETGADAAGLVYDALERARAEEADILLVDTAGRLQNKANLMAELQKIVRVMKKIDAAAPHSVLLVLDATTGQNALNQAEVFREMVAVTGLIVTKLDGSARGGVLVALADRLALPVHAIGVGETIEDMRPFEAGAFARSLTGLER